MRIERVKRQILHVIYRILNVKINFAKKCEFCFETWTWQTRERKFVCEKHMYMLIEKNKRLDRSKR